MAKNERGPSAKQDFGENSADGLNLLAQAALDACNKLNVHRIASAPPQTQAGKSHPSNGSVPASPLMSGVLDFSEKTFRKVEKRKLNREPGEVHRSAKREPVMAQSSAPLQQDNPKGPSLSVPDRLSAFSPVLNALKNKQPPPGHDTPSATATFSTSASVPNFLDSNNVYNHLASDYLQSYIRSLSLLSPALPSLLPNTGSGDLGSGSALEQTIAQLMLQQQQQSQPIASFGGGMVSRSSSLQGAQFSGISPTTATALNQRLALQPELRLPPSALGLKPQSSSNNGVAHDSTANDSILRGLISSGPTARNPPLVNAGLVNFVDLKRQSPDTTTDHDGDIVSQSASGKTVLRQRLLERRNRQAGSSDQHLAEQRQELNMGSSLGVPNLNLANLIPGQMSNSAGGVICFTGSNSTSLSTHESPPSNNLLKISRPFSGTSPEPLTTGSNSPASTGTISGSRRNMDEEKYYERRRRNNEAAKRCRANRRALFEFRFQRSQELEAENERLKKEMAKLGQELEALKALLDNRGIVVANNNNEAENEPPKKEVIKEEVIDHELSGPESDCSSAHELHSNTSDSTEGKELTKTSELGHQASPLTSCSSPESAEAQNSPQIALDK